MLKEKSLKNHNFHHFWTWFFDSYLYTHTLTIKKLNLVTEPHSSPQGCTLCKAALEGLERALDKARWRVFNILPRGQGNHNLQYENLQQNTAFALHIKVLEPLNFASV
jgi:hypothetical protein